MSGKMGQRQTGHKPDTAPRKDAKTDGAFGKETQGQLMDGDVSRNEDKAVSRRLDKELAGAAISQTGSKKKHPPAKSARS